METLIELRKLFEAHTAALAAWDALEGEDWDERQDKASEALDATRKAILDHRPTSIEEVAIKAGYMAGTRTFAVWDDLDQIDLIQALTPTCTVEVAACV
jgi:hypothetical protein